MKKKPQKQTTMRQAPPISLLKRTSVWFSRYLYNILYTGILFALWGYIILNWEKCISMQFFSQFDGNNILFLVGIILIILPFYDIEGKGVKLHRRGMKATEKQIQDAGYEFQLEQREKDIDIAASKIAEESNGGGKKR